MASDVSRATQRTPWFPPDVNPVRKGVYERDHTTSRFFAGRAPIRFSYWTGKHWGGWSVHHAAAIRNKSRPSWEQNIPWRGLARKP